MLRIELSKRSAQQNLCYDSFPASQERRITGGNSNKDSDHMYHGRGNRMDHIQRH